MLKIGTLEQFTIRLTDHALLRSHERRLDHALMASAILSMGTKKINYYNDKKTDVMIQDTTNNFSVVFNIKKYNINVITVIAKKDCYVKDNTQKIII
jgi:hypothetical protein